MNRLKFHGPISQVNFPYSSSSYENISRSSCRLKLEMEYKIIICSFLISSSKVIGRFRKKKEKQLIPILSLFIPLCKLVLQLYL